MSFEPIPEPSMSSDYLKIREGDKHRIRIMGTSKDPATFIQGWEAWSDDNKPHREPYVLNQPCPKELRDLDRDGKPKLFWMFTVWHEDEEKPMVFEVTQSTIKTAILAYANNPAWGNPSRYILEIGRTGTGLETVYTVIAEPPVSLVPPEAVTDAMKEADIDLRVIFLGDSPFGVRESLNKIDDIVQQVVNLGQNDQENIKELREAGEPIPMGAEESLSSVGSVARDAVETLKAAQEKANALAPEMKDGMPY
jgi:hypothetical protein